MGPAPARRRWGPGRWSHPAFSSKTFPSFTTIATGLSPGHHGIVANTMDDLDDPGRFTLADHDVGKDPRWWRGEPIWNTAEGRAVVPRVSGPATTSPSGAAAPRTGRVTTTAFPTTPASTASSGGWRVPPDRPVLVMAYFSLVDTASHDHGPDAPAALAAAAAADALLGRFVLGLGRLGLDRAVNLVVVSDHGMAEMRIDQTSCSTTSSTCRAWTSSSPVRCFASPPRPAAGQSAIAAADALLVRLRGAHPRLAVYGADALPPRTALETETPSALPPWSASPTTAGWS